MMSKLVTQCITTCLTALFLVTAWSAGPVRDGLWETLMTMDMEGMPFKMPATTSRHCVDSKSKAPMAHQPNSDCTMTKQKQQGNTVSWEMTCKQNGMTTTGKGKITYQGDHYEGSMEMVTSGASGQVPKMQYRLMGSRVGPCPK